MMSVVNMVQALNYALDHAMHKDKHVVLLGQDIGVNGGIFRVTKNLIEKYGANRVIDMPLSETLIAGMAVGMATQGLKPIAEFQFMGFMYAGLDQIINHASRFRNRSQGSITCPVVYRMPYGGGVRAPEHHSESMEALLCHIPGLRVVSPSSPASAYGLLLAAIENPDPVIFLEPLKQYHTLKENVNMDGNSLPLDQASVICEGKDITLIAWGAMVTEAKSAKESLSKLGISVELIDLMTLKPLDIDTISKSIIKTGKCCIVQEAASFCGLAAEIISQINETCFAYLHAPVMRVTGLDSPPPPYQLEKYYRVESKKIVTVIQQLLKY